MNDYFIAENKLISDINNLSVSECACIIHCRRDNDWEYIDEHIIFKNSVFNRHFIFEKLEKKFLKNNLEYHKLQIEKGKLTEAVNKLENEIYKLEQKLIWKQN